MAEVGILKPSDRVELIHGDLINTSPIGSKHASIVKKLSSLLNKFFAEEVIIGVQGPIRLDHNNEPEPDIVLLRYQEDYYASAHPTAKDTLVIIEVSDTTLHYDREIKASLYASHQIPVYWVINIEKQEIEVYSKPLDNRYTDCQIHKTGDELPLSDKTLHFDEIGVV